jgi:hypothetical protein
MQTKNQFFSKLFCLLLSSTFTSVLKDKKLLKKRH